MMDVFKWILNQSLRTKVLILESDRHQVFGHFSGTVILDDGSKLKIDQLVGFAENVKNRW